MALYQFIAFALLAQGSGLADIEKRSAALAADRNWSPAKEEQKAALNEEIVKLVDSDALKTGEEFRRAANSVLYANGGLAETRLRYELTITAMALGDEQAAKNIRFQWDQFLQATGRLQHLGSQQAFQGLQADKFAVVRTVKCVETVLGDPVKARQDAAKLKPNAELKKLVDEDQKARQQDWNKLTQEQLLAISKEDDKRRARLKQTLKGITLMTAEDYQAAALVMQHGSWWDDYALAHELSLCSTILDAKTGRQMVALSYDRMLVSGGYLQRVGTQYKGVLLTPVDSVGFNDTMRKALGRVPLAEVKKRLG
jgi:hypothetical protein